MNKWRKRLILAFVNADESHRLTYIVSLQSVKGFWRWWVFHMSKLYVNMISFLVIWYLRIYPWNWVVALIYVWIMTRIYPTSFNTTMFSHGFKIFIYISRRIILPLKSIHTLQWKENRGLAIESFKVHFWVHFIFSFLLYINGYISAIFRFYHSLILSHVVMLYMYFLALWSLYWAEGGIIASLLINYYYFYYYYYVLYIQDSLIPLFVGVVSMLRHLTVTGRRLQGKLMKPSYNKIFQRNKILEVQHP